MWQAPNPKAGAKRRDRQRPRIPIHIKRIQASLKYSNAQTGKAEESQARVMLNDLSTKGAGIFANGMLGNGQQVELCFDDPTGFKLKGRVMWCHEHHMNSHVLFAKPFAFRAGIQFVFQSAEEEAKLKKMCEDLAQDMPAELVAKAA